jgi:glycosyltransferase involved in cell wall biosynthesis
MNTAPAPATALPAPKRIRLTVLLTHPIQYYTPWFRYITEHCADLELTVLYLSRPNAVQQATGYDTAFQWDVPLLDGYAHAFAREESGEARFGTFDFHGIDIPEIGDAIAATRPDVVLIPGWHSITYVRALRWCRRHRIPVIWRGDTHGLGRISPAWYARTRVLLHMFDYHLSVGENTNAYLRRFGVRGPRIFSSPHHVDNAHFAMTDDARAAARVSTRSRLEIPADHFVIASVGKIAAHKRPQDVIDAAARMGAGVTVLLVGAGREREAAEQRARAAGVSLVCTGFVNQRELPAMYAAADVLVVPGSEDSWGLVMNEALAVGIPVVGNDRAGATRDLAVPGVTGERYGLADVAGLERALRTVRTGRDAGRYSAAACQQHVAHYSIPAATVGLVAACDAAVRVQEPRILVIAGGLFLPTGMERMTFEILRVLRRSHARIHCSVNNWAAVLWPGGPHLITRMSQEIGASWAPARYRTRLNRSLNPLRQLAVAGDMLATSAAVVRDARHLRATHVFLPEFVSGLRILPALLYFRFTRTRVVLKLPNPVPEGEFYGRVWRRLLDPFISLYVPQSGYTEKSLTDQGIRPSKIRRIHYVVTTREGRSRPPVPVERTHDVRIAFVGQIIEAKGIHLLLDALALCAQRGIDAELLIIGDMTGWAIPEVESYRERLRQRAQQPDLQGRVKFLGFRDDVDAILSGSDMLCVPSMPEQREAFGLVVLEAKHAGIPCVVFPTGALPEHIEQGVDGWICSDVSAQALADGIENVVRLQRAGRPLGTASRNSLVRFSRDLLQQHWREVFEVEGKR